MITYPANVLFGYHIRSIGINPGGIRMILPCHHRQDYRVAAGRAGHFLQGILPAFPFRKSAPLTKSEGICIQKIQIVLSCSSGLTGLGSVLPVPLQYTG
jgi:hypothetical protein